MKQNKYTLRIDSPCMQNWASMAEDHSGRFCSQCSKSVVDFTNLTDTEIINIIKHSSGKICARLTNQQLQKQYFQPSQYPSGLRINKILAGLLLIATTQKTFAKKVSFPVNIVSIVKNDKFNGLQKNENSIELSTIDSSKNVIQGKVIDRNKKDFLPSALVRIQNSKIGVNTDTRGNFKLIIPDTLANRNIILEVLYVGYKTIQIKIDKKDLPLTRDFSLLPAKNIMGEVVVVGYKH